MLMTLNLVKLLLILCREAIRMILRQASSNSFDSFVKARNFSRKSRLSYMNKLFVGRRYIDLATHDWDLLLHKSQRVNTKELRDFANKKGMREER